VSEIHFVSAGRAKSVVGGRDASGGEQRLSSSGLPMKRSICGYFTQAADEAQGGSSRET
jgi:hypothetical protein